MDGIAGLAPQLLCVEADAVRRLVPFAGGVRLDVGHGRDDVDPQDRANVTAHVARATGVTGRVHVADEDLVAHREPRLELVGSRIGNTDAPIFTGERERAARARLELVTCEHAGLDHARRHAGDPVLVVRRAEVVRRVHPLDRVAELTPVADAGQERTERDDGGAPFPRLVEDRLVGLDVDPTESLHATEVVHAVHLPIRSQRPVTHRFGARSYDDRPRSGSARTIEDSEPPRNAGRDAVDARLETEARLRETEEELRFRVGLEGLVTAMSTRLLGVHLDELPAAVQSGLGDLCNYFGVDRSYALKVDEDFVFDLNVEWWAPDVPQRTTAVVDLPIEAQRFWVRTLRSGRVVHLPDVAASGDDAPGVVAALEHDGVQSILFLPLLARGNTVGFLGFEARRERCSWSDESIALMRTVGELFVSAVERSRAEQAVQMTARELEQRNEELERSNRELEQFASIVSHDLKSPLQVVRGFIELLAREVADTDSTEIHTYIGAALRGAERMDRLIDDLLAYSRVGQRPTNFLPIDLNQVVDDVLADNAAQIREADTTVSVDALPTVEGDYTQLRQLVQNLINNAVKFRRLDGLPEVRLSGKDDGDRWTIRLEDNGIGIERRYREEIFDMFSRVHQVDRPGSGIGLAVCARVVANHNGHIWVEDGREGGSAFCFTLSKRPDATPDA